jgi:FlaA1/EpsC-like NDP-sugar epimerase
MIRKYLLRYSNRFISGYLVLATDILIVVISFILAYIIRFNFDISEINLWRLPTYLPLVTAISIVAFLVTRSYVGIIRHTSTADILRIFYSVAISSLTLLIINTSILLYHWPLPSVLPLSIIIIHSLTSLFLMIFTRLLAKVVWINLIRKKQDAINVIIYGAGKAGILTKNTLLNDIGNTYNVLCFVDENPGKIGKNIEGIPVVKPGVITSQFIRKKNLNEVIIAIHTIDPVKKREIADAFLQHNVTIKNIPPIEHWINGELKMKQIKHIKIEDLLQREPIILNDITVIKEHKDKVVLVTGAAGSIGSEIARQLMHYPIARIILLDQAETPLHDLSLRFKSVFSEFDAKAIVLMGDVSNSERMDWLFRVYKPDLVYHAAAYKHVPMMEENPGEAVRVNVFGTRILADTAIRYGVQKFVMVSTDKAVNASNVMGATKRVAEIYTQSLNKVQSISTRFTTTRFGNVLGSSGSVIPLFRNQIEEGGPLTVTHPEITRFFMTIPEACQLVLEAGTMGNGGEIYIFDMGQPIKIIELARNMIRLSGLQPEIDIKIVYTGLRPGEKLYEELLNVSENTLPTHHPRIMIAKVRQFNHEEISNYLDELGHILKTDNNFEIVACLKKIVPDYKSSNSIYESLDLPDTLNQEEAKTITTSFE